MPDYHVIITYSGEQDMIIRTLAAIFAATLVALQGCALTPDTTTLTDQQTATAIPATDPTLDHYIAWIPREKAQTAAVAKALTHITLGNAREQTAAELCDSSPVINGKITGSVGPLRVLAPLAAGGYPAWYYRISQQPGQQGCAETDNRRFYQLLQANLPVWMNLEKSVEPQKTGSAQH
jgi:hypothetical protein